MQGATTESCPIQALPVPPEDPLVPPGCSIPVFSIPALPARPSAGSFSRGSLLTLSCSTFGIPQSQGSAQPQLSWISQAGGRERPWEGNSAFPHGKPSQALQKWCEGGFGCLTGSTWLLPGCSQGGGKALGSPSWIPPASHPPNSSTFVHRNPSGLAQDAPVMLCTHPRAPQGMSQSRIQTPHPPEEPL